MTFHHFCAAIWYNQETKEYINGTVLLSETSGEVLLFMNPDGSVFTDESLIDGYDLCPMDGSISIPTAIEVNPRFPKNEAKP